MPNSHQVNKHLVQLIHESEKNSDSSLLFFRSTPGCDQKTLNAGSS